VGAITTLNAAELVAVMLLELVGHLPRVEPRINA
jgi:hypothetical protein